MSEIIAEGDTVERRQQAIDVLKQGLAKLGTTEVTLFFPLIEQLVELQQFDQAEQYRDLADRTIEQLEDPTRTTLRVQLLHVDAWQLAKHGRFVDAAVALAEGLTVLPPDYLRACPDYVAQSWANVGQYYRMAGDWRKATDAYQRAATLDGTWGLEYRWALASQKEAEGNLGDAVQQYQQVARTDEDSADSWLRAASVSLRQQLLLPPDRRDWTSFERAMKAASAVAGDRADWLLVLHGTRASDSRPNRTGARAAE